MTRQRVLVQLYFEIVCGRIRPENSGVCEECCRCYMGVLFFRSMNVVLGSTRRVVFFVCVGPDDMFVGFTPSVPWEDNQIPCNHRNFHCASGSY